MSTRKSKSKSKKRNQNRAITSISRPSSPNAIHHNSGRQNSQPTLMAAMQMHSGPLPPPAMLAEYSLVRPDLPEIIVDTFTGEVTHRRKNENKLVDSGIRRAERGQLLGFGVVIAVLGLAGYMVHCNMPTVAGITVGVDLLGLASIFVLGSRSRGRSAPLPPASQEPPRNQLPPRK